MCLGGGCAIPTELQGIEIPIIPDADCEAIWGDSFQPSNMICVLDTDDASSSACNVSSLVQYYLTMTIGALFHNVVIQTIIKLTVPKLWPNFLDISVASLIFLNFYTTFEDNMI